jgi:histidinol phosphatase-like PHP family hydrolase
MAARTRTRSLLGQDRQGRRRRAVTRGPGGAPEALVRSRGLSGLIRADFHVHTTYSDCADPAATPEAMVQAAQEAGLEAIGITDHIAAPINFDRPWRVRQELPAEVGGLRVYVGCEAEMHAPDRATISRELAEGLDFTVFAASHLHNIGPEVLYGLKPREMAAFMIELMRGAIETGYADIIAHPFHAPLSPYPFAEVVGAVDRDELGRTAGMAARSGVAFECNPRFLVEAPEQAEWLFTVLLGGGCKLSIASDAHHPDDVGCRGPGYATEEELREIGISEECLWRIEERATGTLREG